MDSSIRVSAGQRKTLLQVYRRARVARRALVLLLLDGWSYRGIAAAALASPALIRSVKRDFAAGGLNRVLGGPERSFSVAYWLIVVVHWLLHQTPQDFGFFRARWSCGLLAMLLRASAETVRRGCIGRSSCGAGRGRWSVPTIPTTSANCEASNSFSPTCQPARQSSSRTRRTCISIPRSAGSGWFAASRPKW